MSNQNLPGYKGDLGKNVRTIAEVLKSADYSTYMAGKWHVTPHVRLGSPKHNWPRQRGFDRFTVRYMVLARSLTLTPSRGKTH